MGNIQNNTAAPDLSYLKEMVGDDKDALKDIISIFCNEAPFALESLEESAKRRDHNELRRISHSLIAELTTVGILSALHDLKRINKSSKEIKDLDEATERVVKTVRDSIEILKTMF